MLVPTFVAASVLFLACSGDDVASTFGASGGTRSGASGASGASGGFGNGGRDGGGGASSGGDSGNGNCSPNLTGLVRDFRPKDAPNGHPDFQSFENTVETTGLVEAALGADKKPVFRSVRGDGANDQLTSKADFDVWYRDTPNVNESFTFVLPLAPTPSGTLTFSSSSFFPIDGKGFGNSGKDDKDVEHNFHFTFELHLEFVYRGGETFTFTGDDDLWTFFNGKLGIDLGGLHPARSKSIELDARAAELGIETGKTYALDVFHAERRTVLSNFRIDTTLEFVNCDPIIIR